MIIARLVGIALLLTLAVSQSCTLPTSFHCNFTDDLCVGFSQISSLSGTYYNCTETLKLEAEVIDLRGTFSSLDLTSGLVTLEDLSILSDINITTAVTLTMKGSIQVEGLILIRSNLTNSSSLQTDPKGSIKYTALTFFQSASVSALKLIIIGMRSITWLDSTFHSQYKLCLYNKINVNQFSSNMTKLIFAMDAYGLGQLSFAVFVYASDWIGLQGSVMEAVSIAVVSLGNISLNDSTLNSSARSCRTNTGRGRGTTIQYQDMYCTSGSSSCGYGSISNYGVCEDIVKYFMFLSHSLPYISKGPFLSTGSGGYGFTPVDSLGGAGGGIVFIFAEENASMNTSNILAEGGSVGQKDMFSAGSGGTIFITSDSLTCVSFNQVSAAGGNCSNGNGSGAGGLVKISFYQVVEDNIWVNINMGIQNNAPADQIYSNGIFYGPTCKPGYQAYYMGCQKCPVLTYSGLGDPICRPCPAIAQLQFDNNNIANQYIYQCYSLVSEPTYTAWLTPGSITLLSILLYLASLIIFTIIGGCLKKRIKKEKSTSIEDFRIEDVKKDIEKAKILALELRQSMVVKPHELMYHVHRISCYGTNTEESPWVLPLAVPEQVKRYVHPQVFKSFAEGFNEEARWTGFEYWMTKLSCLFYPLYWYYKDRVKHRKFMALLTRLQHAKDYNLLNNYDYEDRSIITIKFSKNKDYTNCYLDFFVYERADTRYFNLLSPFLIYLSGEGNFLRPYYLEEDDVFFRMMFFVVSRNLRSESENWQDEKDRLFSNMVSYKKRQKNSQQLFRFLRKLNTVSCTLDLAAPKETIVEVLWSLAELMERWNKQFFNLMTVQVDMLILISKLMEGTVIDNDVQVLTTKDRKSFEQLFLRKLYECERCHHTIKIALCVYNPEQQLPKQQHSQMLIQEMSDSSDRVESSIRESLIPTFRVLEEQKGRVQYRRAGRIGRMLSRLRYYTLSHQKTHYDEYIIKFLQSLFILMQTMLVFIWSIKLQLPYVFVNLISPFIGIIWFVSDSYGFGKLYLILTAMTLLNKAITMVIFSIVEVFVANEDLAIRTIVCAAVNMLMVLLMLFIGKRAITLSKKLSLKKEDDLHPKRDE